VPSYKVKGTVPVNHDGKLYQPGETIEDIPAHVAIQLRWQLEPENEEDAFPETATDQNLGSMAAHERVGFLEERQRQLQQELEKVGNELAKAQTEQTSQIEARKNAPDNAQGTVETINPVGGKPTVQSSGTAGVPVKGGPGNQVQPAANQRPAPEKK
jgi:hypothetical protein